MCAGGYAALAKWITKVIELGYEGWNGPSLQPQLVHDSILWDAIMILNAVHSLGRATPTSVRYFEARRAPTFRFGAPT